MTDRAAACVRSCVCLSRRGQLPGGAIGAGGGVAGVFMRIGGGERLKRSPSGLAHGSSPACASHLSVPARPFR